MAAFRIVSTPTDFIIVNEKSVMQYINVQNNVYPHVFFSELDALNYLETYIDNDCVVPSNNSGVYLCN